VRALHLEYDTDTTGADDRSAGAGRGQEVAMKAFVMKALDAVGFMDKPIPKPGPCDAIVKTTRALICTSDSHTVHGGDRTSRKI